LTKDKYFLHLREGERGREGGKMEWTSWNRVDSLTQSILNLLILNTPLPPTFFLNFGSKATSYPMHKWIYDSESTDMFSFFYYKNFREMLLALVILAISRFKNVIIDAQTTLLNLSTIFLYPNK